MRAVELLLEDHGEIERMLRILAGAVARLRSGEPVDGAVFQQVAKIMLEFADRYHHVREEEHVFPVLEQYALLTMAGRLDCMPGEHEIGRGLTTKLRDAADRYAGGDATAIPEILDAAGGYLQLLGHHMGIEEGVLFELADKVVSDEDDAAMTQALEKVGSAYRESGELARIKLLLDSLQEYAQTSPAPTG
jgi:hemerythrin-like domain-containing protein